MRQSRRSGSQHRFLGRLVIVGLSALTLVVAATDASAGQAASPHSAAQTRSFIAAGRDSTSAAAGAASASLPAGGVLGDVAGRELGDIVAIDQSGRQWLYPNTGGADQSMFGARALLGVGWTGYTLAAVAPLFGPLYGPGTAGMIAAQASIVAIDPAGRMWYYQDTGGTGIHTFFAPSLLGVGWTGYRVVGLIDLYGTTDQFGTAFAGIVAIDPAGRMWYYPGTGGTGMHTFGARSLLGVGWNGYTADAADINGDGRPDILAVDSAGTVWLYPSTGHTGTSTFGTRSQLGPRVTGFQAVDAGLLTNVSRADILGIDAAGNMWCYPNTGNDTFGTPFKVGVGWAGFRIN